jgi:hypothetical protein
MPEVVLHLASASVTLYEAAASGVALTSGVGLWQGSCPAGMSLKYSFDVIRSFPTGVQYGIEHHVNESHSIEIPKVAIVDDDEDEFLPERDAFYAMKIEWTDQRGRGLRRTYYGVKSKSLDMDAQGVDEYTQVQAYSAQYFISEKIT